MRYFENRVCHVATLHGKEKAIRTPFELILGMKTIGCAIDTDQLGTFSLEVKRDLPPLLCAKQKCLLALKALGNEEKKGCIVGSEGTFGPHPGNPFIACGHEIIYFIDVDQGFELFVSEIFSSTNFFSELFIDWDEVIKKVVHWRFPSHALVVRPHVSNGSSLVFKGIASMDELKWAFQQCRQVSCNSRVWVETDMRAHKNPIRMDTIGKLAEKLAYRLSTLCPKCANPGWGILRHLPGLACAQCGYITDLIASCQWGCPKCTYVEMRQPENGQQVADPACCPRCNP